MKAKMKDKKQSITEFLMVYGWAILVVLVAIGALVYFGVIGTEDFREQKFCETMPDKCVSLNQCDTTFLNNECKEQYRKLTPQELLEKDCQENPRDDKDCKCLEYKEYKNSDKIIGSHGENCKNITMERCNVDGIYSYNQELQIMGDIGWLGYCDLTEPPREKITSMRNISIEIYKENITNCERVFDYEQYCIKSQPKTECEKGNNEWVEETTCINSKSFDPSSHCISDVDFDSECCNEFQTICREKINEEKLVDKSCEWLKVELYNEGDNCINNFIQSVVFCNNNYYQNLKQAWRNKGCKI